VINGLLDPELTFYSDEAWFTLSGYINSQNDRYWFTENPHAVHKVLVHDEKLRGWCAISARRIRGPIFLTKQYIPIIT
jgi:hypothetical protein